MFDWTWIAIAAPFIAALVAPLAVRLLGRVAAALLALVPAGCFVFFVVLLPPLSNGLVIFGKIAWLAQIGVEFSTAIDALSVLFLLTINFVAVLILLDVAVAPASEEGRRGTVAYSLLASASAQGLVLADSFIALIAFSFAMTASAVLLALLYRPAGGRLRAVMLMPAAAFAANLILLGSLVFMTAGTANVDGGPITSLTAAINTAWTLRESDLHLPLIAAMLAAILVFTLQVPVAARLAAASAHALAGVYATTALIPAYLLMRVHPFLGDTPAWSLAVPILGALILIVCAVMALRRASAASVLGWTATASVGAIMIMVGTSLNSPVFGAAAMVPAHAFALAALVLIAGEIGSAAPGRPALTIALLAVAMLGGAPLTVGYLAKAAAYEGLWDAAFPDLLGEPSRYSDLLQAYTLAALASLVAGNGLILAALFRLVFRSYTAPAGGLSAANAGMLARAARWLVPALFVDAGLTMALVGGWSSRMLIDPARYAINLAPYGAYAPTLSGPALWLTVVSFAVAASVFTVVWAVGRRAHKSLAQPVAG